MMLSTTNLGHALTPLGVGLILSGLLSIRTWAQTSVSGDATLSPGTIVTPTGVGQNLNIEGGFPVDENLFHSFQAFSIFPGQTVTFVNVGGFENILGRVTGGDISTISGLLSVEGNANLFLINPQGVVFGPGADLELGGSFFASSANSIEFEDGTFGVDDLQTAPALLVGVPVGLQLGANAGSIQYGAQIFEPPGSVDRTIGLIGANIAFEPDAPTQQGFIAIGELGSNGFVPAGSIIIGSVAPGGNVDLIQNSGGWQISAPSDQALGNVSIARFALAGRNLQLLGQDADISSAQFIGNTLQFQGQDFDISSSELRGNDLQILSRDLAITDFTKIFVPNVSIAASGTVSILNNAGISAENVSGASIAITAENLILSDGSIRADAFQGDILGSSIAIDTEDSVILSGFSSIVNATVDSDAGSVSITTDHLRLENSSQINSSTRGKGDAGQINVVASDSITITDRGFRPSAILSISSKNASGDAGAIAIATDVLTVQNGGLISTQTLADGAGGQVEIEANTVDIQGQALDGDINTGIFSSTAATKNAGTIILNADSLSITGKGFISTQAEEGATGEAGGLLLEVTDASLDDGGQITAANFLSTSQDIQILGVQNLDVQGGGQITASTETGTAGNVIIVGPNAQINVSGQNSLIAAKAESGDANNVEISAQQITVSDRAQIATSAISGTGGDVVLHNLESLDVQQGGQITASTETGTAGNVIVTAPTGQINVAGAGSAIAARAVGDKGNASSVQISAPQVNISDDAQIAASTTSGTGGNITFTDLESLAITNGTVTASTVTGKGGDVVVNTAEQPANSVQVTGPQGVISAAATASGEAGNVSIYTKDLQVRDGGQILATTTTGKGGGITLHSLETLAVVDGRIAASTDKGTAGNLIVNTPDFPVQTMVLASVTGDNQVQLLRDAAGEPLRVGLFVEADGEAGTAGSLEVYAIDLKVENSAISVSNPAGPAGNLSIQAAAIALNGGQLEAITGGDPNDPNATGANIELSNLRLMVLSDESLISASALNAASGGNIDIAAPNGFIIALPLTDSDIVAEADAGQGGEINLQVLGIYGLEERQAIPNNGTNDLSVNSISGQSGNITINDLATDPSRSRTDLPESVLDARNLIDRSCEADLGEGTNSFVVTGRGGLPLSPEEIVRSDNMGLADLGTDGAIAVDTPDTTITTTPEPPAADTVQIIEAQTWYREEDGTAILTAQIPEHSSVELPIQTMCDHP